MSRKSLHAPFRWSCTRIPGACALRRDAKGRLQRASWRSSHAGGRGCSAQHPPARAPPAAQAGGEEDGRREVQADANLGCVQPTNPHPPTSTHAHSARRRRSVHRRGRPPAADGARGLLLALSGRRPQPQAADQMFPGEDFGEDHRLVPQGRGGGRRVQPVPELCHLRRGRGRQRLRRELRRGQGGDRRALAALLWHRAEAEPDADLLAQGEGGGARARADADLLCARGDGAR